MDRETVCVGARERESDQSNSRTGLWTSDNVIREYAVDSLQQTLVGQLLQLHLSFPIHALSWWCNMM